MDETDKALEEYKKNSRVGPKGCLSPPLYRKYLFQTRKNDEAIAEYKQVLTLAPDSPVGYNELAYYYAESETNLDKGLEYALKAAQLAPKGCINPGHIRLGIL